MIDHNKLTIVMYHYVRPIKESNFPKIKGLEFKFFQRQLDYLSQKYHFITAEELIDYSLGGSNLPNNSCYLTFDDGFKDHIKYVMPELLLRGIQGSFFPPADAVMERKMLDVHAIQYILASVNDHKKLVFELIKECVEYGYTENQINSLKKIYMVPGRYDSSEIIFFKRILQHVLPEGIRKKIISKLFNTYIRVNQLDFSEEFYISLSDAKKLIDNGMYLGSHGTQHIWLGKNTKLIQISEVESSLQFLKKIGAPIKNWIMCYPFGSYNIETLDILKSRNCSVGLTTKVGLADLDRSKLLELSRFDANDFLN